MSGVLDLGPMWVKEVIGDVQAKRNKIVSNLERLNPEGDYAAQHRIVLDVLDRMLAAVAPPATEQKDKP